MEPADAKRALREGARAARRAIPPEVRAEKSRLVAEKALALPEVRAASAVACYVGVRSEVDTTLVLRGLLARGVVVAVPAMVDDRIRMVRLQHPWALAPAAAAGGVPEPRQPWTEVEGGALGVVMVPGLRFGRDGSRLGNGGGHFDRFLAEHPGPRRVGLAFAEQVVPALDVEAHDQGMDVVVTDAEVLRAPRRGPPAGLP
ncbi:MAG TPA: 5-formyltetrahydrofolate cyclo-ligase [Candidatus Thermoplasmatota archaeon]|nr:5-formyltetrahydrofolate cyclo-ligase [Candidatus Thermoplasmatota archaeon]